MRALVTGGAGFIGSHLTEALVDEGHEVRVVDCLTDYYDLDQQARRTSTGSTGRVEVVDADLRSATSTSWSTASTSSSTRPASRACGCRGPRGSPPTSPTTCSPRSACSKRAGDAPLSRFVFASSSSVYGDAERYPTVEDDLPEPRSPYGVTKLAAEHLCSLYAANWEIPTVALRYFTVYGPRQRPDMAFHRLCEAIVTGDALPSLRRRLADPRLHLRRRRGGGQPRRGHRRPRTGDGAQRVRRSQHQPGRA